MSYPEHPLKDMKHFNVRLVVDVANNQECVDVTDLFQSLHNVEDVLCISTLRISKT